MLQQNRLFYEGTLPPCVPVHKTFPSGAGGRRSSLQQSQGGLCQILVAWDPPRCPLCAGLSPSHCREGELVNLCAMLFLVQSLGGEGDTKFVCSAGSPDQATSAGSISVCGV